MNTSDIQQISSVRVCECPECVSFGLICVFNRQYAHIVFKYTSKFVPKIGDWPAQLYLVPSADLGIHIKSWKEMINSERDRQKNKKQSKTYL